ASRIVARSWLLTAWAHRSINARISVSSFERELCWVISYILSNPLRGLLLSRSRMLAARETGATSFRFAEKCAGCQLARIGAASRPRLAATHRLRHDCGNPNKPRTQCGVPVGRF